MGKNLIMSEEYIISDYFTCDQIKPKTRIWKWDLNNTPSKTSSRILILAQLIKDCQQKNQKVLIRPDKRLRARGLCVIFANDTED